MGFFSRSIAAALPFAVGLSFSIAGSEPVVSVAVLDRSGATLVSGTDPMSVSLDHRQAFRPGDQIVVTTPKEHSFVWVQVDDHVPISLIYVPGGRFTFTIPFDTFANAYDPEAFRGTDHHLTARVASPAELSANRNLALNAVDQRGQSLYFPHATASNATRNDPVFFERNAIDGNIQNAKHGKWPFESWGNDRQVAPWFQIDFGRAVTINKVRLYLRADFPHDSTWTDATMIFSDGGSMHLTLRHDAAPQEFSFPARTVSWLKLDQLNAPQNEPKAFEALTEMEVYGCESQAVKQQ
jgi:hypothetical protein